MRVQEFVVSFVLPVDEECPALKDEEFMKILDDSTLLFDTYPNLALSLSQVRDATPKEADDFAFDDDEDAGDNATFMEIGE